MKKTRLRTKRIALAAALTWLALAPACSVAEDTDALDVADSEHRQFRWDRHPDNRIFHGASVSADAQVSEAAPAISEWDLTPTEVPPPDGSNVYLVRLSVGIEETDERVIGLQLDWTRPDGETEARFLDILPGRISEETGKATLSFPLAIAASEQVGVHQLRFRPVDALGTLGVTQTAELSVGEYDPPLEISSVGPLPSEAGAELTIKGRGFGADATAVTVTAGSAAYEILSVTDDTLTVEVPDNAVAGPVVISTPSGEVRSEEPIEVPITVEVALAERGLVKPGDSVRLITHVRGLDRPQLAYTVNGVPGGTEGLGTVDDQGRYYAPVVAPNVPIDIGVYLIDRPEIPPTQVVVVPLDPCAQIGSGEVDAASGATIVDGAGLGTITVPAAAISEDAQMSFSVSHDDPGAPEGEQALALVKFTLSAGEVEDALTARAMLPVTLSEADEVHYYRIEDGGFMATDSACELETDGQHVVCALFSSGEWVVTYVPPQTGLVGMYVTDISVPADRDLDHSSDGAMFKEGFRLPVMLAGGGLDAGHPQVRVVEAFVDGSPLPAVPAAVQVGPASVDSTGTKLGFTLDVGAIETLGFGQIMSLTLEIQAGGQTIYTDPSKLSIFGLDELIVDQTSSLVFAADGTRIDRTLSDASCPTANICPVADPNCSFAATGCYSKIDVRPGATLGIGIALGAVELPAGDGTLFAAVIQNLAQAEAVLGRFGWLEDEALRQQGQLFVPLDYTVQLDVTRDVVIDGSIVLRGMRGGGNHDQVDPSNPASGALGLPGGLVASVSGVARASGGLGGNGGIGSNAPAPGTPAGQADPLAGLGRDAFGAFNMRNAASGGLGINGGSVPLLGWLDGVINAGIGAVEGDWFDTSTYSAQNAENFGSLLGDAGTRNLGAGKAQKDLLKEIFAGATEVYDDAERVSGMISAATGLLNTPGGTPRSSTMASASGRGGGSGLAALNRALLPHNFDLPPGAGGDGGGGGGSSLLCNTFPEAIPIVGGYAIVDAQMGGGGGGGGGASGALRITAGHEIRISRLGEIVAIGGDGGHGQRHVLLAGNGGGGGGGAGGLLKLQAPVVYNEGDVDVSGGNFGGALLGMNGVPLASCGRVQILDGLLSGGFLHYDATGRIDIVYPTGRLRNRIYSFGHRFAGLGIAFANGSATNGLIFIDEATREIFVTGPVDYDLGRVTNAPSGNQVDRVSAVLTTPSFAGFVPQDIAQDPAQPHNIFVSGYRLNPGSSLQGVSEIWELDASGQLVGAGPRFSQPSCDGCIGGMQMFGHLRDIDFLKDGRLVGTLVSNVSPIEPGLWIFDRTSNTASFVRNNDISKQSLSVFRDPEGEDQLAFHTCFSFLPIENEPPAYRYRLERESLSGAPVAQETMVLESMGWAGGLGLARIDGLEECSDGPKIEVLGLPSTKYDERTHFTPTIGAVNNPSLGLFDGLVVRDPQVMTYVHGAEPLYSTQQFQLNVQPELAPGTFVQVNTNRDGTLLWLLSVEPGFNRMFVVPTDTGPDHPLLSRHVLRLD